jgi:hypothetical protein
MGCHEVVGLANQEQAKGMIDMALANTAELTRLKEVARPLHEATASAC